MTNSTITNPVISLSDRVYRALLIFYPAEYRREYGALMAQVFRDMCRAVYRERGSVGIAIWWCTTLLDLALTAIEQRRKAGIQMNTVFPFLRRISAALLIIGGVLICIASVAELQPGWNYPLRGIYQIFGFLFGPALLLICLGIIGMVLKYQNSAGTVGRLALFGAAGGVLVLVAYLLIVLITKEENLWNMFIGGFVLHAASMVVFGLTALGMRPLPRWNWLPIVIGAMPFFLLVFNPSRNGSDTEWENIIAYVVMGLAYAALGVVMYREQVRETAAPVIA